MTCKGGRRRCCRLIQSGNMWRLFFPNCCELQVRALLIRTAVWARVRTYPRQRVIVSRGLTRLQRNTTRGCEEAAVTQTWRHSHNNSPSCGSKLIHPAVFTPVTHTRFTASLHSHPFARPTRRASCDRRRLVERQKVAVCK